MKKIILIGGAPIAGKSTIAAALSQELSIPCISTEQIKRVVKISNKQKDVPHLYRPKGYETATKFLSHFSPQKISDMEYEQASSVWPGIQMMIDDDTNYKNGCIIEGLHIVPHLIARDYPENKEIISLFIGDNDDERIRNILETRGLFDIPHNYSSELKEVEQEWLKIFSKRIEGEAKEYNFPFLQVSKSDNDLKKALELVNNS